MTNRILLFLASFCFANVCLGQSSQKISTDERQALAAEKSAALAEKQLWASTGLGLGSLMVTLFIAGAVGWYIPRELERSRAKTERTRTALRLLEELYSIEFYAMVLVPVRRIQLKWTYLASPEKEAHQQSVLRGWIDAEQRDANDSTYLRKDLDHFNDPAGAPNQLTEHGALSKLLTFFSDLYVYLENELMDPKLAKHLFSHIFGYYGVFLIDLCAKVRAGKPDPEPTWAQNLPQLITKYLEPSAK
jgi:hypothetical protein